jgi:uncharacterized ferritin-like protein (DUF455 family)
MIKRDFFELVWDALCEASPVAKTDKTLKLFEAFKAGEFEDFDSKNEIKVQSKPSYSALCEITHPATVQKRRRLDTDEGKAVFLHAITHIEYSAIDLGLDACYSFRGLPKEFYFDWLEVAAEECEHFLMLEKLLTKVGGKYGDYPVHSSLFEACRKSETLLKRMAAVPRYLEAGGLDANKKMTAKIQRLSGPVAKEILDALGVILRDEIDHVTKGTKWFYYACEKESVSPESYFDIVESVLPNSAKQKDFINIEDRLKAGFKCEEIKKLTTKETKC